MKNKKGLTLLELIVVVAIIGIMSSVIFISMSQSKSRTALEQASREVAAAIRETQNYALTGKVLASNPDDLPFRYIFMGNGSTYRVRYMYNSGGIPGTRTYATYELKNGVSMSNTTIYYAVPHATKEVGSSSVTLSKAGASSYYVCICLSGKVVENGTTSCGAAC